jgi:CheY-like chemotaxis protein
MTADFFAERTFGSMPESSADDFAFRRKPTLSARETAVCRALPKQVAAPDRAHSLGRNILGKRDIKQSHTILVVDDEWALAEVLSAILRDEGYRTLVAGNGREAETLLKSETVDLVVVDFMMPIMDAPALIAWMKEEPALKMIPLIIMTSLPEASVRARCDGFAAYLQKPFMIDDIAEAVARYLPPQQSEVRS